MDTLPEPKKVFRERGIFRIRVAAPLRYLVGEVASQDETSIKFHCRIPTLMTVTLPSFDADRAEWLASNWSELVEHLESVDLTPPAWTERNWHREAQQIAALLFEDLMEDAEEDDLQNLDEIEDLDDLLLDAVTDSDWFQEEAGRLAVLDYASSRYDVTSQDIFDHLGAGERHRWKAVQRATCLACMIEDVRLALENCSIREKTNIFT